MSQPARVKRIFFVQVIKIYLKSVQGQRSTRYQQYSELEEKFGPQIYRYFFPVFLLLTLSFCQTGEGTQILCKEQCLCLKMCEVC